MAPGRGALHFRASADVRPAAGGPNKSGEGLTVLPIAPEGAAPL